MKPFLLKACCKDYIWGGNRLRDFGKTSEADRIAESWELSTHPDGESVIASGEYEGMTLTQFLKEHPEAAGTNCECFDEFPVIVKLIDAHENLSVQVHPDKTELWYVIAAEPGASILLGFREEITREAFREAIENGTLLEKMQSVPVQPGNAYWVPAGTLHAIGKGILIAEVQQNSNNTYRVYDYDRGRELHVEQAVEVTSLRVTGKMPVYPLWALPQAADTFQDFGGFSHFSVTRYRARSRFSFRQIPDTYVHHLIVNGWGTLNYPDGKILFETGDSIFIPAGDGTKYDLSGEFHSVCTTTDPDNPNNRQPGAPR